MWEQATMSTEMIEYEDPDEIPDLVSAYASWSGSGRAALVDWEPADLDVLPRNRRFRPSWSGQWEAEWKRAELDRVAMERDRRAREAEAERIWAAEQHRKAEEAKRRAEYEAWRARNAEERRRHEENRRRLYEQVARRHAEEMFRRRASTIMESRDQFSDPDSVQAALDHLRSSR